GRGIWPRPGGVAKYPGGASLCRQAACAAARGYLARWPNVWPNTPRAPAGTALPCRGPRSQAELCPEKSGAPTESHMDGCPPEWMRMSSVLFEVSVGQNPFSWEQKTPLGFATARRTRGGSWACPPAVVPGAGLPVRLNGPGYRPGSDRGEHHEA